MSVAEDVMETQVVRVGVDEPILNAYRLFYEEEISGAPVVDENDRVVGVLSMSDLIRTVHEDHKAVVGAPDYYRDTRMDDRPEWLSDVEAFEDRLSGRPISEVMTSEVVSVTRQTPISEVVSKLLDFRIHRILVLEEKANSKSLAGIITLFDLIALLE